ncbi:divalent-cation tolerance protein CutA [Halocatena salina]|uniref:Divalent-cation tolerance protein CutA n=1 Tax=Halocatena salina TaxID=2934340 RepID=A0A8U0A2F9_9EURY|nr:divalent-cation tolerance protein CutA [Halocatena salina]UPM43244.1 divalent-cation tolerance protein CutA [Halocatena salina]
MPTAFITCPRSDADELATGLLEDRLAACVNVVDCRSVYRWEGETVADEEAILLAKTTDERYDDLVTAVQAEHPHDVPCIERFEETPIDSFRAWRDRNVGE